MQDPARPDLYAFIHKALRRAMADTLCRLGALDLDDPESARAGLAQLAALLAQMKSHVEHENRFLHPAIEARQPGASSSVGREHEEHIETIDALADEARALGTAPASRQPQLAQRLYRHFALFVAENLQHMHQEETAHNAALWAHYRDAELHALHAELLASIPADEMMRTLRWMAPALSPRERAELFGPMQRQLPPAAFGAVLAEVRPTLDDAGWARLARALNLPPVPGLVAA